MLLGALRQPAGVRIPIQRLVCISRKATGQPKRDEEVRPAERRTALCQHQPEPFSRKSMRQRLVVWLAVCQALVKQL